MTSPSDVVTGTQEDLRGTPKGQARQWEAERLVQLPYRKRRIREKLVIAHCPDGWHSDSGSADGPSDTICHSLSVVRITGRPTPKWWDDHDGWRAFHAGNPCVWKVESSSKDGYATHFYCDAELPDEYRELASGPEGRLIDPGPRIVKFSRWGLK